ncbi:MAG: ABC transporter substrate-binding protein [bacterium]
MSTKKALFRVLCAVCLSFTCVFCRAAVVCAQHATSEQNSDEHAEKAHEGGSINIACTDAVRTLDPQKASLVSERWVLEQIYDGLYEYDTNDRIVPVLATDFPERSEDGSLSIPLRSGIVFHDGTEFDANDVVFTLQRLLNPATQCPTRELFQGFGAVEAASKLMVRIHMGSDCPDAEELLTRIEARPLPKETVIQSGDRYGQVTTIGTGPFRLSEWDRDKDLILIRNYSYALGSPLIHKAIFTFPQPGVDPVRELKRGRIELISPISPKGASILSSWLSLRVEGKAGQRLCQIYLNCEQYPFDRPGIRRAVSLGINRAEIIHQVFQGFAEIADSCIPPWHRYHDPHKDPANTYDPNTAREILGSEGFTEEFPVSFSLMYTDAFPFSSIAVIMREQLSRIHVQVHLVPLAKDALFDYVYGRKGRDRSLFQAALEDWEDWRGGGGAEQFTWRLYHSSSPENKVGNIPHSWEQDLARAVKACDPAVRDALFTQAITQIDQAMVAIYLCYPHRTWVARNWVNGQFCNSLGNVFVDRVWVR